MVVINLKIGFRSAIITPKTPLFLAGYDAIRKTSEINDDINVRIMIIKNDKTNVCLISYDLIAIDDIMISKIKEKIINTTVDNIFTFATHTHSAPMGTTDTLTESSIIYNKLSIFGITNLEFINYIVDKTLLAINDAMNNIMEMKVSYLKYTINNIGSNRNDSNKDGDNQVTAMVFTNEDRKAVLFNYGCHPTVLNSTNTRISGDLFSAIARKFSKDFDFCIFSNGACGDISTRFNRKKTGFVELDRLANIFYDSYQINKFNLIPIYSNEITIKEWIYQAKVREPMIVIEAYKQYEIEKSNFNLISKTNIGVKELRLAKAKLEGTKANWEYSKNYRGLKSYKLKCLYLKIGELKFIGYPGEIFSELTNPLKLKYDVNIVGYCNGYSLYLTNEEAFNKFYYEAMISPFERGEGEKFIAYIANKLSEEHGNI
jgi:hypothetical protein